MKHEQLLQLIQNFFRRLKEENVHIEALAASDSKGLYFVHHFVEKKARNIYSHSKSFTSIMLGIALDNNLLSLDDHVVDYFKEELTEEQYKKFYPMLIIHPLTMRSGFDEMLLMDGGRERLTDYLQFIFSQPWKKKPGERFLYSNADTYIVARILEKVFKNKLNDEAFKRIFSKMDIEMPYWEEDKQGHTFGASGLQLTIEDMNKLGILVLNRGTYNGKRIVSEKYIDMLYETSVEVEDRGWGNYSLQLWHTPEGNGIRADGAYGQLTFIYPQHDIALSIQRSEDNDLGKVLELIKEEILRKL